LEVLEAALPSDVIFFAFELHALRTEQDSFGSSLARFKLRFKAAHIRLELLREMFLTTNACFFAQKMVRCPCPKTPKVES
jgi:hypothetical protein